ncbi:hypothetical protein C4N9_20625 [Pararhodobacter marinus]|uniref:Uncharacterized protein n=1 Tax=Pararhodobacter marinus TaxID=2184063 RepID=A0A2U2C498_9RHOB|nr:hypothetical protein [Pararhodobacter marinus]PWE26671.1 hypothetical protein C4N9_20625 [Pararhodobacter marinus]
MTDEKQQVGRLAMRVEGDWWVAYYALPETMEGALELGRIRMAIVEDWQAKELFMSLMRDAVTAIIRDRTGAKAEWPEPHGRPAPEHERAGRG